MNITKKQINSFRKIANKSEFEEAALFLFQFQYENNTVYHEWVNHLGNDPKKIKNSDHIPFLPISFFKSHEVKTGQFESEEIFTSSGTTGQKPSQHFVKDLSIYQTSFIDAFEQFFGNPSDFHIMALLPSYLEREGSSLIYMTQELILQSRSTFSGFFLNDYEDLFKKLIELKKDKSRKTLLIGVTYALLDFAERYPYEWDDLIIMETGGMKGRRKEMIKEAFYPKLRKGFGVEKIASEYGMTELLSQAYAKEKGEYQTPAWMDIKITNNSDPLEVIPFNKTGKINVIDLMNIYSCSFICTDDLGKKTDEKTFKIMGRTDHSEARGCNLMLF